MFVWVLVMVVKVVMTLCLPQHNNVHYYNNYESLCSYTTVVLISNESVCYVYVQTPQHNSIYKGCVVLIVIQTIQKRAVFTMTQHYTIHTLFSR